MLTILFSWAVLVLLAAALVIFSGFYVRSRLISTRLIAVAAVEFFDNSNKLLKTPEDLPDSVLEFLQWMVSSMENGDGSQTLLAALKRENSQNGSLGEHSQLRSDVEAMRPELAEIFENAVSGWLNFVIHRHAITQFQIHLEMGKMAVKNNHSQIDSRDAQRSLLSNVFGNQVAC